MMLPPDNDLDKLFKDAGDNYDAPGAKPDWNQMQSMLDKDMPVTKDGGKRRILFLLLLLLLSLAGTLVFLYSNNKPKTNPSTKDQQAIINPNKKATTSAPVSESDASSQLANNSEEKTQKNTITANAPVTDVAGTTPPGNKNANKPQALNKNNNVNLVAGKSKNAGDDNINTGVPTANRNRPFKKSARPGRFTTTVNTGEIGNEDIAAGKEKATPEKEDKLETGIKNPEISREKEKITTDNPDSEITKKTDAKESALMPAKTADTSVSNKKDPTKASKNKSKKNHGFELSLLYAPEITTIGFSNVEKPGSNYGLLLGYQISDKLTLQTGLVRSRKNYSADGSDYVLNYPPVPGRKLEKASGYCMMYEIPLNIKGRISTGKKLNVFYTAGISSYFMTSEYYTYYYSSAWGDYTKSMDYHSQKNYWLSLANIGVGVEKNISPNLYIGAMPYLKVPFKGMGEGQLKLLSAGVNFTLGYKPAFKKK